MNTLTLNVTGMSCMGCVNSVKNLVTTLPGIDSIDIDLASGRVVIAHDAALSDAATIRSVIEDGGYGISG